MSKINLLDAQSSNMIAAGEVVDRPAGALKELLENAIDSGASVIRASIKGGGSVQITVSDNGDGIEMEDMPRAVLRHATSKIKTGADIDGVMTLGFRGEALAAISAVSKFEMISRRRGFDGYLFEAADGQTKLSEVGCPDGTTVIVNDLFYNTPARRKFLKRDATEAASCTTVIGRLALSHPEISFSFLIDGIEKFRTAGDGDLYSAIYAIYGRETAKSMIPVNYTLEGIEVSGFISVPDAARGNRMMQIFYVNRRVVNSKTALAATEEACRSFLPTGKYPAAILFVSLEPKSVDVNVHPAKTEVKFVNEKQVFSAIFYAVKNALTNMSSRYKDASGEVQIAPADRPIPFVPTLKASLPGMDIKSDDELKSADKSERTPFSPSSVQFMDDGFDDDFGESPLSSPPPICRDCADDVMPIRLQIDNEPFYRYIGEAYDSFIVAQTERAVYFIDKHALHERVLYEQLATKKESNTQWLLSGLPVTLSDDQVIAIEENREYLSEYGFVIDPFGDGVIVRAVPTVLADSEGLKAIVEKFAWELSQGNAIPFADRCDRALFTIACKAAIKAGQKNAPEHNEWLVKQFFESETVRYCPHGRPVSREITRREIEKYFDR